jgi:hypothetical protein
MPTRCTMEWTHDPGLGGKPYEMAFVELDDLVNEVGMCLSELRVNMSDMPSCSAEN